MGKLERQVADTKATTDHKRRAARCPFPSFQPTRQPTTLPLWMGGTLHGAGENRSRDWRYGAILTYSPGWVRQEENQYLDVPRERVAELSPEVRRIVGFDMYAALGFHDRTVA